MKAVIFCEDSAFLTKARSILQRVGHRPEVNVRWTIKTWSVFDLARVATGKKALRGCADAHLIIISDKCARSLPPYLLEWLERWAAIRRIADAAVGVIGHAINSLVRTEVSTELRRLLEKHGLNLLISEAPALKRTAKLSVSFSEGAQPEPIQLAHPSYRPVHLLREPAITGC